MPGLDLSRLTPGDALVALAPFRRRYRAELSPVAGDDRADELAARYGPDGVSALDVVSDVTRSWGLISHELRRVQTEEAPTLHPAVTDAGHATGRRRLPTPSTKRWCCWATRRTSWPTPSAPTPPPRTGPGRPPWSAVPGSPPWTWCAKRSGWGPTASVRWPTPWLRSPPLTGADFPTFRETGALSALTDARSGYVAREAALLWSEEASGPASYSAGRARSRSSARRGTGITSGRPRCAVGGHAGGRPRSGTDRGTAARRATGGGRAHRRRRCTDR